MTKIQEILKIDINEDIKSVIDVQDHSELEIQKEIESYIITEGIGHHLDSFINKFTSNIKETGVWLSGFYGSGKSYFGKMLGYVIANPSINGTPARERFIMRLKGISNEGLIENSICSLNSIKSQVIFLDVAKQNTDKGLAYTLFSNFLKNLGFRNDVYGYMEFDLFIDRKLDEFKTIVISDTGTEWDELKVSNRQVAKNMRQGFRKMGYTEVEYNDTLALYNSAINDFSADKLKSELEKYLRILPDETLVFIFDEASEAISQKKFSLLDLEGISEALSSISNKVWTIAIAQEKLDDVINNANVNRSQLTKVTDRFKTKIHLESTEVDIIIRNRLLQKKESAAQQLFDFYKKNEGLIADATNLRSAFPTKTKNAEEFTIYYPFHKYQFDVLQKFLFSSNALVATQIAARGMIITTFDVLRKQMREKELYSFTPGYAISTEAQTAPPIDLVNKYDTAKKILHERSKIDGEKLLKTIHLLSDSEVVSPTVENITKSYIFDITSYYDFKPSIEEALTMLLDAKVLLLTNSIYKITSDLEGKLLEEMNDFTVEFHTKKRFLTKSLKDYKLFSHVSSLNESTDSFKFSIVSDQDDELSVSGDKQLKLIVYSLYNISGELRDFIESQKMETQYQKDRITLIPDNKDFSLIDRLIGDVSRYSYMEEKYSNESDPIKRQIIRNFSIIKEEKEKELRVKIEKAYCNTSLVYMFDEYLINADSFKSTISDIQRRLIKNVYTKRLSSGLSDSLVLKIFSSRKEALIRLFSGEDFRFFDTHGNFTGDHLKVVEEINAKIKNRYVDGRTLESELFGAPWGYSFGTIVSTLSALLRAGRLSVKYNGDTFFSHEQNGIQEAFTNATKFRSASFKSITARLTADQKNQAVQLLINLEIESHINRKVNWSINDFDLADSIRIAADQFISALRTLNDTVNDFESLFPVVANQKLILQKFSGKVTDGNYIEKVEFLLNNQDEFSEAINTILKAQKFIKKNFPVVKDWKNFIENVVSELDKADRTDSAIQDANKEFIRLFRQDMVKNYNAIQQQVQVVRDSYYKLMKTAMSGMSYQYKNLNGKVEAAAEELKKYPSEVNIQNKKKLEDLKKYCSARIVKEPELEYSVICKNCGYSLTDILNYTALIGPKESELLILQSSFIKELPEAKDIKEPPVNKNPRKIHIPITSKFMTVQEYKSLLTTQLSLLATARPDEEIELDVEL